MKIVICVDDVHPEVGWGLLTDPQFDYFRKLNDEFGAKFNFFVPSNYHHRFPISTHKDWIHELSQIPWIELCAHGHFHDTSSRGMYGECEFGEYLTPNVIQERISMLLSEWSECGVKPIGWRSPGWVCTQDAADEISKHFKYVAVHNTHDKGIEWGPNIHKFYGHDGIHSNQITLQDNDTIMFQSHINGKWNDNKWSNENFEQFKLSLTHLCSKYADIEFITLNSLV